MDNTLTECAAVEETVVFLNYFKDLHDPRQQGKVCYPLEEILLLCLLAVVAGAETITEIAIFGAKKLDLLRRLRCVDHRDTGRRHRDRREDVSPVRSQKQRQGGDPHGVRLRRAPASRAGSGQGTRKIQ